MRFDQVTGQMIGQPDTWIDSIYPLPREFHDAFIDMDRTYRSVDVELYPTAYHLTAVQKQALLFIGDFYRTHPIAGPKRTKQDDSPDPDAASIQDQILQAFKLPET